MFCLRALKKGGYSVIWVKVKKRADYLVNKNNINHLYA